MSPDKAMGNITLAKTPLTGARRHGFVIGLAGWSGSGKTTLAEQLIGVLTARDRHVATIKHAHHRFDADVPGKDSHRHRSAGACQVLVSSALRSVLFTEHGTACDRPLDDLLAALAPADIVMVEGFKREPIPKIEIYREVVGKGPLWLEDEWIIAAATDAQIEPQTDGAPAIILDLNDAAAIADLICGLADAEKPA
jgi:molybdopterin-guanine dinucleotide biosynthesis protein B